MSELELNQCPKCKGQITLFTNIERGVFARCEQCKSEYDVCSMDKVSIYDGVKIRKSTIRKIEKMWNRMADNDR